MSAELKIHTLALKCLKQHCGKDVFKLSRADKIFTSSGWLLREAGGTCMVEPQPILRKGSVGEQLGCTCIFCGLYVRPLSTDTVPFIVLVVHPAVSWFTLVAVKGWSAASCICRVRSIHEWAQCGYEWVNFLVTHVLFIKRWTCSKWYIKRWTYRWTCSKWYNVYQY